MQATATTFVRSKKGRLALAAAVVVILVIVLVLLLTGGGSAKPGSSAGSSDSQGSGGSASGPTYSVGAVQNCAETLYGGDSVSSFTGPENSIKLYQQATEVVGVEAGGSSGTFLFFSSPDKAAGLLPAFKRLTSYGTFSQPNGGNVIFRVGKDLPADDASSLLGCLQ